MKELTSEQFITLKNAKKNMEIIYFYHLENGKKQMGYLVFANLMKKYNTQGLGHLLNEVLDRAIHYFECKFEFTFLLDKKGNQIKLL